MKKIIGILGVAVLAVTLFLNGNSINNSGNNFDLAGLISLNPASAQSEGTGQSSKSVTDVTEAVTEYGKIDTSGSWIVLAIGVEGGYSRTITRSYKCCDPGGNNCSSNLRDC